MYIIKLCSIKISKTLFGKVKRKCGSCNTIFLPSIVDGVSLKEIKTSTRPKTDKLIKSDGETEQRPSGTVSSKLSWLEISPDENCDNFYDIPKTSLGQGSPNTICSYEAPSLRELHCLCVAKNGKVKNVCGICTKTLKISK